LAVKPAEAAASLAASPSTGEPSADLAPFPAEAGFHGFVVGIGASAGGLDALERLFGTLPADSGAAFVVIQHLSPDHKSMMDNLLARYTGMPVRVAEHDMPLAANSVFLIPPAKSMRLAGDRLLLSPKPEHGLALPIDVFFHSLAEQCADRAIAVVLSGTGSDGSRGVPAVNAAGGFVFVQEPADAKFDGMPRSAIGTGLADVVAPTVALAERLLAHLRAPRSPGLRLLAGHVAATAAAVSEPLEGILKLLLAASGIDFREYKPTTVLRRIERRMLVQHADTLAAYRDSLALSPQEQSVLRRELLIPVTRFFRDGEVFDQLAEQVVAPLVQRDAGPEPIRVWVACCATGEEAYSIAMLFLEAFQRLGRVRPVKIFATDVEAQYIEQAAAGQYPDTIAAEVSGERLERWFFQRQGGWAVRPEVRQMVIFARHNLVADAPFTRMDLVSCRNALIYLQPAAQERALRRLQYALAPGAHLMLGPSESLGVLHRDFAPLPGRHKLYQVLRRERPPLALDGSARLFAAGRPTRRRAPVAQEPEAPQAVALGERQLQRSYLPPSLLVGPGRELLHVYGDARALLQFGEGQATLDVLRLLPRELSWAAALLLPAVTQQGTPQRAAPVRWGEGAQARWLRMVARRVETEGEAEAASLAAPGAALMLLSFESLDEAVAPAADHIELDAEQRRRVETLERELEITHASLQATIEELETANEELQATNEELMASNEELQSTNEELQSVNEELYTVNAEYQEKVDVLNSVNADLENIAKATATPTLFVDEALHLMRFTPELTQLFKLREGDRGRSIEDFAHTLDYPELFADLRRTLAERVVVEREVRGRDGQWWLARTQPYVALGPGQARAVMSFVNVTSLKDSQRMQAVIDSLPEHLAVLDVHGHIVQVNAAWRRFASAHGDTELHHTGIGSNYLQVCARAALTDADARAAFEGLSDVLAGRRDEFTLQYPCATPQRQLWFLMHVAPVHHAGGGAVVSHIDITAWARPRQEAP
jgi:two-component system CheB/CheR fusion protein